VNKIEKWRIIIDKRGTSLSNLNIAAVWYIQSLQIWVQLTGCSKHLATALPFAKGTCGKYACTVCSKSNTLVSIRFIPEA